jgi:ketosteroid isomerase-like protein
MASPNLDLVRSIYAAQERGDFARDEWVHPDIEFVIADGPSPGRWNGPEGLTEGWRDWLSAWQNLRVETQGFRELDGGRVLVLFEFSGHGKTSGLSLGDIEAKGAALYEVDGKKVVRIVAYWNRDRALADLGLKE